MKKYVLQISSWIAEKISSLTLKKDTILTYVRKQGLEPTRGQALVLKLIYGLPLTYTERAFVASLRKDGLTNYTPGHGEYWRVFLSTGRRGGKTTLLYWIAKYET